MDIVIVFHFYFFLLSLSYSISLSLLHGSIGFIFIRAIVSLSFTVAFTTPGRARSLAYGYSFFSCFLVVYDGRYG